MTEPSEAAKAKALELYRAAAGPPGLAVWTYTSPAYWRAACEQLVQQVSDAAKVAKHTFPDMDDLLDPFILSEPVDPLVAAMKGCGWNGDPVIDAAALRAELTRRGFKIVKNET